MVLGTPVIAITILLVAAERLFHFGFFDPARRRRSGALPAPVLVLLAPGRLHHDAAGDGRRQRARRRVLPQAGLRLHASSRSPASAIAVLGFLVWGHHMFVAGQSVYAALIFSILSFLVAIPSAVKVFNWTATMYKGSVSWETPMLYAIGFIGLFTIGGLTGLFLAAVGARRARHRHLLHRRALPLHHGRRHDHGLSRRPALLVAEDQRPPVQRVAGEARALASSSSAST